MDVVKIQISLAVTFNVFQEEEVENNTSDVDEAYKRANPTYSADVSANTIAVDDTGEMREEDPFDPVEEKITS